MLRTWAFEEVKTKFESEGYKLLDCQSATVTLMQRLDYECPDGHRMTISLSEFDRGYRCFLCKVKDLLEAEGFTLLSATCENAASKIEYKCPAGHQRTTTVTAFRKGHRCAQCYQERSQRWVSERRQEKRRIKEKWCREEVFSDRVARLLSDLGWSATREYHCGQNGIVDVFAKREEVKLVIECKLKKIDQSKAIYQLKKYALTEPDALLFFACPDLILDKRVKVLFENGILPFPFPHKYQIKVPQGSSRQFVANKQGTLSVEPVVIVEDWNIFDLIE